MQNLKYLRKLIWATIYFYHIWDCDYLKQNNKFSKDPWYREYIRYDISNLEHRYMDCRFIPSIDFYLFVFSSFFGSMTTKYYNY